LRVAGAGALAAIVVALSTALFAADASAETYYYRWIDKDGKTQFSDKPPASFKGEVTKVLVEAMDPVRTSPPPAVAPKGRPASAEAEKAPDVAARRRAQRELLEARLAQARQNLEAAKKALADGEGTTQDEKQFVRENFARNERQPQRTPPPRGNCMASTSSDGKAIWNCPRPIPNEAYFDRQKQLEEAVKKAEEEVTEAERAYRRGVD